MDTTKAISHIPTQLLTLSNLDTQILSVKACTLENCTKTHGWKTNIQGLIEDISNPLDISNIPFTLEQIFILLHSHQDTSPKSQFQDMQNLTHPIAILTTLIVPQNFLSPHLFHPHHSPLRNQFFPSQQFLASAPRTHFTRSFSFNLAP